MSTNLIESLRSFRRGEESLIRALHEMEKDTVPSISNKPHVMQISAVFFSYIIAMRSLDKDLPEHREEKAREYKRKLQIDLSLYGIADTMEWD